MAKKEIIEKEAFEQAVGVRATVWSTIASIVKLIVAIVMLPLVIGLSRSLAYGLQGQPDSARRAFYFGVTLYVVIHVFLFVPRTLYESGQAIIGRLFGFFVPLRRIMYLALPLYTLLFFLLFLIVRMVHVDVEMEFFLFFIGFSFAMHLVLSAQVLHEGGSDALRGGYVSSLCALYIVQVILCAAIFFCMFTSFSFTDVMRSGFLYFVETLKLWWHQLFVI